MKTLLHYSIYRIETKKVVPVDKFRCFNKFPSKLEMYKEWQLFIREDAEGKKEVSFACDRWLRHIRKIEWFSYREWLVLISKFLTEPLFEVCNAWYKSGIYKGLVLIIYANTNQKSYPLREPIKNAHLAIHTITDHSAYR